MRVERTEVGETSLEVLLRAEPAEALRTSAYPGLPGRALALLPGLARHRCDNPEGRSFVEELPNTEMAHLFEHVACELMALAGSPRTLRGETRWDFHAEGHGVFRVRLAYDDDLVALGAVKAATTLVDYLTGHGEEPDVEFEVARLLEVRG